MLQAQTRAARSGGITSAPAPALALALGLVLLGSSDRASLCGATPPPCGQPSCRPEARANNTLLLLNPADTRLRKVSAADAAECCRACRSMTGCVTWSFTHAWAPSPPCHLSAQPPLRSEPSVGSAGGSAPAPPPQPVVASYAIDVGPDARLRQVIEGVGFEIQSDSIGSGFNPDVGDKVSGVPHDLVPSERVRFYRDMLRGFRTCRLALGLYLRGLDAGRQHIRQRWPTQMQELAELQNASGITGFEVEYWSPPPYWKGPNQTYSCSGGGHTLRWAAGNRSFVEAMATAMAADVAYLGEHGLRVRWWGMQNEPQQCPNYAGMVYNDTQYHALFAAAAPRVLRAAPGVRIEAGAENGCASPAKGVFDDPTTAAYVTSWTFHTGGQAASTAMTNRSCGDGKSVWVNEWEYFRDSLGPADTVNLAAYVINTFVFWDAPKFTWLHALKPTYNAESLGFGLGFWRPPDDNSSQPVPLEKGHFRFNNLTWNAMGGFPRHMPWNVRRVQVDEDVVRADQRIMAFVTPPAGSGGPLHVTTPGGMLGIALTNQGMQGTPLVARVNISGALPVLFRGHRYNSTVFDLDLGEATPHDGVITLEVPPQSVEFWVQY